ncbi:hypothetical protein CTAYLR_004291 [Chrysophaeum taylorii]|uniref:Uncharacterized protein n=1 Tax=Chrysophaeum taylorii TaxID=2483200 RepID=A0AAD7UDU9_9STRA|nr:hypothetical protein CTAYLR_004291 [Chrysophaeum taylorii]
MRGAVERLLRWFAEEEQREEEPREERNDEAAEVVEQLVELHQQLAARRQARKQPKEGRSVSLVVGAPHKVIVCSVHKPVRLEKVYGVDAYAYRESHGGLKAAMDCLAKGGTRVRWVSWPGECPKSSQEGVRKRLEEVYECRPVFVDEPEDYAKFCHGILWPLFHCIPSPGLSDAAGIGSRTRPKTKSSLRSAADQYEAYARVNSLYLEAVAEEYDEGDLVVVYDYQLMLLPAMLRKRFHDVACAYFVQCPFPSSEFYRMLPAREALLHGALGADLVSFNHFDYVRHFLNACMRVLGLETSKSRLEYNGRLVAVSICPAGINPDDFDSATFAEEAKAVLEEAAALGGGAVVQGEEEDDHHHHRREPPAENDPDPVGEVADRLRRSFKNRKVIVSIAGLDMSKGIPQKLLAMESLLTSRPEWRGKATLVLAARDRGGHYDAHLRRAVDGLVGHVNGKFGRADYCPVMYVKHDLKREEVVALYSIADVALVASVREGINFSAMEFVASQSASMTTFDDLGVLVYSEFAGCASSFEDGALLVNPYDSDGVSRALHHALTMSNTSKQVRHHKLARYVNTYTAELWGTRLVRELQLAREKASEYTRVLPLDVARLRSFYERSQSRLLVFEYSALLHHKGYLTHPSAAFVACLEALCADPANVVYVLSGRKRDDLASLGDDLFRQLGLVAEFGYWLKHPRGSWERVVSTDDLSWMAEVVPILEDFTRHTPGSFLETNETCVVWHFRDSDSDFGPSQAKDLQLHLDVVVQHRPVRVVTAPAKHRIVVQPSRVSKGRALRAALRDLEVDLLFAVGDERADDDIFEASEASASAHSFTCTLGKKLTRAAYYLDDDELLPTLQTLAATSTAETKKQLLFSQHHHHHHQQQLLLRTPSSSSSTVGGGGGGGGGADPIPIAGGGGESPPSPAEGPASGPPLR